MSNLKLKIRNVAPIRKANMEISRINVIGGRNSTGKSTTSDLLYCLLRSLSSDFDSTVESLLESEFDMVSPQENSDCASLESDGFKLKFDFRNYEFTCDGGYDIRNVFYFDSFSLFDNKKGGTYFLEHVRNLENALELTGEEDYESDLEIESLIKEILGGQIVYENGELLFKRENGLSSPMKNTSSGVKQVSMIQALLLNGQIGEGSFLIMDEPEVNLHPEWQIKFARILVLMVKHMGIGIYIASHSPFFIEAIELYSKYYELLEDSRFYLTKKSDDGLYDIVTVDSSNLEDIYRNLGKPYDMIDELKMELLFKKLDEN